VTGSGTNDKAVDAEKGELLEGKSIVANDSDMGAEKGE